MGDEEQDRDRATKDILKIRAGPHGAAEMFPYEPVDLAESLRCAGRNHGGDHSGIQVKQCPAGGLRVHGGKV